MSQLTNQVSYLICTKYYSEENCTFKGYGSCTCMSSNIQRIILKNSFLSKSCIFNNVGTIKDTHISRTETSCLHVRVHPLTPHFYIVKLGLSGVFIIFYFALKHRLWVLVRTASLRRFLRVPKIYVLSNISRFFI